MLLKELVSVLEEIAPTKFAASWDNVGLLTGDPKQTVSRVLLTIDYTAEVAAEAERERCDAVVAYHPPIFKALKRVTAGSLIFDAIRKGIAIWSPHTALDVADGGTSDVLADALGLVERQPLRIAETKDFQYKLVTFVPEKDLANVSKALFDAGAGKIGNYTSCSFRSTGTGTFFGEEGTNPAVGEQGKLEQVEEVKVETVVPVENVNKVLQALRWAHPYEEPAFDLVRLAAPPEARGLGRIGKLEPTPRGALIEKVKKALGAEQLLVAGPTSGDVTRGAVCCGSCGDLLDDVLAQRAEVYLTGELRHHDALRASAAGVMVMCALHSVSERAVIARLRDRLSEKLPSLAFVASKADADPFRFS
jgi:dinuclear metal center YbgI/SA1388 family protein